MNKEHLNAFANAVLNVLPMLGLDDVTAGTANEYGKDFETSGVVCIVGIIGDVSGNVIYSMNEDTAKFIASAMMGGMEIAEFDELTQSAISELGNMLAANSCMGLSETAINADISTPTLMQGVFSMSGTYDSSTCVEIMIGGHRLDVYISLEH